MSSYLYFLVYHINVKFDEIHILLKRISSLSNKTMRPRYVTFVQRVILTVH